jgi:hypothetical protein
MMLRLKDLTDLPAVFIAQLVSFVVCCVLAVTHHYVLKFFFMFHFCSNNTNFS